MPSMTKRFSAPEEPSIEMPPACDSSEAPAACATTSVKSRPRGMRSMRSREMLVVVAAEVRSIATDSPVTVIVSVIADEAQGERELGGAADHEVDGAFGGREAVERGA